MLTRRSIQQQTEWAALLRDLPQPHVLQSWQWGEFKSRWAWQADRVAWFQGDTPVAAAQILSRPIPYTPYRFWYVSKGPIFDYQNLTLTETVLTALEQYARQQRAMFVKIDPDVVIARHEAASSDGAGQAIAWLLLRRGWRFSPEQIQVRNTIVLDLTPDEATLLAQMKSKWRYNIRLAGRKGVVIRQGTLADVPTFYQMYATTARRDGFLIRPAAYYRDVWSTFMRHQQAEMLLATVDEHPVAGLMLFLYGETAWYLYGASTEAQRKLMPNHLLQWTAMQRAKQRGCTRYDLWGAPDTFDESDSMWGVYRFKQGFNGTVLHGLGAWDYPVKPRLYWGFTQALPRVRRLWRKLRSD